MTEQYNVFISYAWHDNETSDKSGTGWVSTFVDRLRMHLNREVSREIAQPGIWLDYEQMRGSDNISAKIRAKLEASRLLVPIISKSYLDSPWCQQEREIFMNQHGVDSGRIFPVWMEPVENMPAELDKLLKYSFWYKDNKNRPRIRWFPDIDPTDREYSNIQQDMARDMAARLQDIVAAEQKPTTVELHDSHRRATPNGKHMVLVNGGEDDNDLINQVAARLCDKHGIGAVAPMSALPDSEGLKSSIITRDLRAKLKHCTAVLFVYNKGPLIQVHQHFNEYLKSLPKLAKNTAPPALTTCHPADREAPPGLHLPEMKLHACDPDCAADCAARFASELLAGEQS